MYKKFKSVPGRSYWVVFIITFFYLCIALESINNY